MRRALVLVPMVVAVLVSALPAVAAPVVPTVSTDVASDVAADSATLHGVVNPEGAVGSTTYHFEWGFDTGYGNNTDEVEAYPGDGSTDGTQDVAVSWGIGGLSPNTAYHYRLVATSGDVTVRGDDESFTTSAIASTVDAVAGFATAITTTSATVHATLNAQGSDTTYHFNYGTSTAYGSVTPDATTGVTSGDQAVTAELSGLSPGTVYHFQLVADNGTGGPQASVDYTLRTVQVAPAASLTAAGINGRTATLSGMVDAHGVAGATYVFAIQSTSSIYAVATDPVVVPAGGPVSVSATVPNLPAGESFEVRLTVTLESQAVSSAAQTITTAGDGPYVPRVTVPDDPTAYLRCPPSCPPPPASPAPPSDTLSTLPLSVTVSGSTATLKVTLPGAGRVAVTGSGLSSARASVSGAGVKSLKVKLTAAAKRKLAKAKSRKLTIRATVRFTPKSGTATTATKSITFKRGSTR